MGQADGAGLDQADPRKDAIVSEYLDTVIERLRVEDLLEKKEWVGEPAPETPTCPIQNLQKEAGT
jgi:small conductance mechanosensitive channel